jgi:hypothetical protein
MMTYLDLVNAFILEFGINGGVQLPGIYAATNTKEALRIAGFIADADYEIQSLYNNWRFLWRPFNGQIVTPGSSTFPLPSKSVNGFVFRMADRSSLCIRPNTTQACYPIFSEWEDFRHLYVNGVLTPSDTPEYWSIDPARNMYISSKTVTANLQFRMEGWAQPYRMKTDADVSPIVRWLATNPLGSSFTSPGTGNTVVRPYGKASANEIRDQSGRIITMRAAMIYATVEGAMEVMQGAMAEYEDMLMRLVSIALPGQESDMASSDNNPTAMYTP